MSKSCESGGPAATAPQRSSSPAQGRNGRRSRRGCWTCRRRHKKCDERRPACQRCQRGNLECEGYDLRLTWGEADAPRDQPLAIVRPCRRRRRPDRPAVEIRAEASAEPESASGPQTVFGTMHFKEREMDLVYAQYQDDMRQIGDLAVQQHGTEDTEERLLNDFVTNGYLTLTGRSGPDSLFSSEIVPRCRCWRPLRHVSIAYQASLMHDCQPLAAKYLQLSLSEYAVDLQHPDRLQEDLTLATGILHCSVSITSSYIWTPLLRGLHFILQSRGLLDPEPAPRSPLTQHLLEAVALLDIPHLTLNRMSDPLHLWTQHVGPYKAVGVEEISGLPFSLLNILATLAHPDTEDRLSTWPGELAQHLEQIHLWEAYRTASILHFRMLTAESNHVDSSEADNRPPDSILIMKTLASVQAICNSKASAFARPLASSLVYPLFIAGMCTLENTKERSISRDLFQTLESQSETHVNQLEWDFLLEIWERRQTQTALSPLDIAIQFAKELNIEMHLY